VIVVCDGRLVEKPWGKTYFRSLPKMLYCEKVERIPEFLVSARAWVEMREKERAK